MSVAIEGWNSANLQNRDVFVRALESLRSQTYPTLQCEIIVIVDAGSANDGAWIQRLLPGSTLLELSGYTYFRCKNLAMEKARGEFLVFADSDVVYDREWLARMLASFRPGVELVAGRTRYRPGPFYRSMAICDGGMFQAQSGPTQGFFAHNLAMRASVFRRFKFEERLGPSGGGAAERLRDQLRAAGIQTWYCAEAQAEHHHPGFLRTRLRLGAYRIRTLRMSPQMRGAWLARVPLLGPLLVTGAALVKAWTRVWKLRASLSGGPAAVPLFLISVSGVLTIDLLGACAYAWAGPLLRRRVNWFDVPPEAKVFVPRPPHRVGR